MKMDLEIFRVRDTSRLCIIIHLISKNVTRLCMKVLCIAFPGCLVHLVSSDLRAISLTGEFWLGLRKIHSLAAQGNSVLHIQLEDWKQGRRFIEYRFDLNGPESNYSIHLMHLAGDLPDLMSNHSGMMFSTKDRDNDKHPDSNCAQSYTGAAHVSSHIMSEVNRHFIRIIGYIIYNLCNFLGGWWFNACGDTNLNGRYFHFRPKGRSERRRGIQWRPGHKASYSLKLTQISVHPVDSSASASSETGVFQ